MLAALASGLIAVAAQAGETNAWLGKTTAWEEPSNWSAGAAPSSARSQDVLISAGDNAPVLGTNAAVGGSLTIAKGARLSLNGHDLQVGTAICESFAADDPLRFKPQGAGLIIAGGASLQTEPGTATITLDAGGLINKGTVRGKPRLHIAGRLGSFRIQSEKPLELAEISTAPALFPYAVEASGNILVQGNLDLAGGKLTIKAGTRFEVKGDLIFRGREPLVMLVTEGDLMLHGTIRSEGSAFCVEAPGSHPVWDKAEEAAFCQPTPDEGWLCLVGAGDQTITPGGILPAMRIDKPSGKVTVAGDLHCNGLHVRRGNTLDLSKGQKLILGHYLREWAGNPERNGVPEVGPCRTSRDLLNEGAILGAAGVPILFQLNVKGVRYEVACVYWPPEPAAGQAPAGNADQLAASVAWAAPGALAINRYKSRLLLSTGKLFLDGKPCEAAAGKGTTNTEGERMDTLLDDLAPSSEGGKPAAGAKPAVTKLSVKTVAGGFKAPEAALTNIAPLVARIVTPVRIGELWGSRDVYSMVDGDPAVGAGGAPFYDFVFPEPVTVSAVRLISGTSLKDGCQFLVSADTADGDKLLAWARDGEQKDAKYWMGWGESGAAFAPQKVSRLRLRAFAGDGTPCALAVSEFEIFADRDSAERLAARPDAWRPESFPAQAQFLASGDKVNVAWPATPPDRRVCRIASIAFWMAGVAWSAGYDEAGYAALPHLKDFAPCTAFLAEVKDRYHFDAVVMFFEGESTGVPWPTVNFKSALNAGYLAKRKVALKLRAAAAPKKTGDDVFDALNAKPADDGLQVQEPEGKFAEVLKVEDLPCQRNLLKEFCEAAHEKGLEVYMISRPEDMGKLYTGPQGQDPYETFLKEGAAAGLDGVSLTPDEEYPLWQGGGYARWQEFDKSTRDKRKNFTLVENRRWIEERSRVAGLCLKERKDNILKVKPDCKFIVDGAHLGFGGDPYDIIWHIADPDYVGCSYQSDYVPHWAATSKNRRVAMGEYPHRTVRINLQSLLLGARMIRSYRFNYIELQKSEDQRIRENLFMEQFMRWGGTRPAHPPTAFLVSRASESWWPEDCAAGRVKGARPDRCRTMETIMYEFLLKNGYTFDVYYLDQPDDLQALKDYKLVILPFAYALPRAAFDRMDEAYKAGANFLIGERKGDVDEVGQPYAKPLLADWIAQGKQAGRIGVPEIDLAEQENLRAFVPQVTAIVDPLLGKHKDLVLKRYGKRIEGLVASVAPNEKYVSFINWENQESKFEAGLNLPAGQYKLLTLSSAHPEVIREGSIAGQKTVSAETLRNFALTLEDDEVVSLYILPAERTWGQW